MFLLFQPDFQQPLCYLVPQAVFRYKNSEMNSPLSHIVSPKFFHSLDSLASVCHIEKMDKEQLSCWVKTFCCHRGWDEGMLYASNFYKHGMTGDLLGMVDLEMLKTLGIENENHRIELLSEIRGLISENPSAQSTPVLEQEKPGPQVVHSSSNSTLSHSVQVLRSLDGTSSHTVPLTPYSYYCGSTISSQIAHSSQADQGFELVSCNPLYIPTPGTVWGQSGFTSQHPKRFSDHQLHKTQRCGGVSLRKDYSFRILLLTLEGDQISHDKVKCILSWLELIDPLVNVRGTRKANTYSIKFQDNTRARKALGKFKEKGFKIEVKSQRKPSPNSPMEYVSQENLNIQEGKSLKGKIVGVLGKGHKVTVNQVKGKRARLVNPYNNKESYGWVSMYSRDGERQLLVPVDGMYGVED